MAFMLDQWAKGLEGATVVTAAAAAVGGGGGQGGPMLWPEPMMDLLYNKVQVRLCCPWFPDMLHQGLQCRILMAIKGVIIVVLLMLLCESA
jgi:hypothetical protein